MQRLPFIKPSGTTFKTGSGNAPLILIIDDDATVRDDWPLPRARRISVEGRRRQRGATHGAGTSSRRGDVGYHDARSDGWTVPPPSRDPELVYLPVVLMTIVDEKNRGYALGAAEYLVKPVDRQKLFDVLRTLCGSSASRPLLVVDDDDVGRRQMRAALEQQGWTVIEASDGRDALTRLREAQPDVVILT
jgi:CheY-like chemotaxis protein